jgi:antitoxin (DNA-binding transcriptional repressor) of toxin-antitoxin stability system
VTEPRANLDAARRAGADTDSALERFAPELWTVPCASSLRSLTRGPLARFLSSPRRRTLVAVATCGYIGLMVDAGIRELKNNLSRYVRRIEAGERVRVTAHGRVVAELGPPSSTPGPSWQSRYDELVAAGIIRPALEGGDPLEGWPQLRLPAGTVTRLVEDDRGAA